VAFVGLLNNYILTDDDTVDDPTQEAVDGEGPLRHKKGNKNGT
jgi:hypothetical protein